MRTGGRRIFGYVAAVFAVFLLSVVYVSPARASVSDVWQKGVWSGTTGWILMNCTQDGSCAVNNYGVTIDATNRVTGWAWSANVGWVCFGTTCQGIAGNAPDGGGPTASIDPSTYDIHGWALIVNLGSNGWISLNCAEMGCASYKVNADLGTGTVTGFGWNGNSDGSGVGWIDFSPSRIASKELNCSDGFDNDSDGFADCADSDCLGKPGPAMCGIPYVCGPENDLTTCQDSCDNDGDLAVDCSDASTCTGVAANGCPAVETACTTGNCCGNGIDDDHDGLFDCADSDCFGIGSCPADEAHIASCGDPITCCSDEINNDLLDPGMDCADASCVPICTGICRNPPGQKCIFDRQCAPGPLGLDPLCNPTIFPWLESFLNDIYGGGGIQSTHTPPQSKFNATFCLISTDTSQIINFTSELCASPLGAALTVPSTPSYKTTLGRIDLAGIIAGKYGPVTHISGDTADIPGSGVLDGRIWVIDGNLTISNPATLTSLDGRSGGGLVVVRGDLFVNANVDYAAGPVVSLSNLASLGWVVVKNPAGLGGNVSISPTVTSFSGLVFAENTFDSGAGIVGLTVHGPILAKTFQFSRAATSATQGSESVIFDSRSNLNPPPGLADVAKSLPTIGMSTP